MIKYRTQNDDQGDKMSDESSILCMDKSLTIQSMSEDADINVLMHRYGITGSMPESLRIPQYGDFEGVDNYQDALHVVMNARDEFMKIPAKIRARFDNDPGEWAEFVMNPENAEEAIKMGFKIKPPSGEAPAAVPEPPAEA